MLLVCYADLSEPFVLSKLSKVVEVRFVGRQRIIPKLASNFGFLNPSDSHVVCRILQSILIFSEFAHLRVIPKMLLILNLL